MVLIAQWTVCNWLRLVFNVFYYLLVKVPKFYGIITLRSVSHGLETAIWPNIMLWV